MTVTTVLAQLLVDESIAKPAADFAVWEAHSPQQVAVVLRNVMPFVLQGSLPSYLRTGSAEAPEDLGVGPWARTQDGEWKIPADLNIEAFLGSSVHDEGNYLIYQRFEPHVGGAELPRWGFASTQRQRQKYSAKALVDGLLTARVHIAIAVHADASDAVVVVPPGLASSMSNRDDG